MADRKKLDLFGKAKDAFGDIGSKVEQSVKDIKDQTAPAAEKVVGGVKKQTKKTKDAIEARAQQAKDAKEKKEKEKHTIVQLAGTKIKILLPDGYERLKFKNPLKDAAKAVANDEAGYRKTVTTSDNIVMIQKTTPEKAMNPDDVQGLIDGIHDCLSDSQGIIEARNGTTERGYRYIYSIVKNLSEEQFGGVRYFLRLNLFNEEDIIEIQADFTEIGTTGGREAVCVDLARRAGLADVFADGFKDWTQDPYDPDYTKGALKNLAEKEGLDGLFPDNPLSQAHEFLLAVLNDEFVTVRQDSDDEDDKEDTDPASADSDETPEQRAEKEKEFLLGIFVDECRRYTYHVEVEKPKDKKPKPEKPQWFGVGAAEDRNDGWGEESDLIIQKAAEAGLDVGFMQMQGNRIIYIHCLRSEIDQLVHELGEDSYGFGEVDKPMLNLIKKNIIRIPKMVSEEESEGEEDKEEKRKREKLDDQLRTAVNEYNEAYTMLSDHGTKLFNQRERSIDLLGNVENLINSVANHPKEFDADIAEIRVKKQEFRDVCDFAKEELSAAKKSAAGAGAGVAGGMAVASVAPSAAMWIATTFGTASTGTAISSLSGAAATKAALAWIGGGALSAGGGGVAAGQAFLAMTGPIGWSIAGATLLTSIVLFANKKIKLDKEKKEEIEAVLTNTEQLKETDAKLDALLEKTDDVRQGLSDQYTKAMQHFGKNFLEIDEAGQMLLGTIVNNAKALAISLGEGV